MMISLACVLATVAFQPPTAQPPVTAEPRRALPARVQPPAARPQEVVPGGPPTMAPGQGGGWGVGNSQFGTGAFPLGATFVSADPNGSLSIETIAVEFQTRQQTRTVPVTGPGGQTQDRQESYTVAVPIMRSVKRPLPPEAKIYRNGREVSAEEQRGLGDRTPIFVSTMGSPNVPPGQGYEAIFGNALVAYIKPATPAGASGPGAAPPSVTTPSAPVAKPGSAGPPLTSVVGKVERIDPQAGTVTVVERWSDPERKRARVSEANWRAANGTAYETNGQPITPSSNVFQRLQVGDAVLWVRGQPPASAFSGSSTTTIKLILSSPPTSGEMSGAANRTAEPQNWGDASADERAVVEKANEARAAGGLPPLKVDATLMKAARQHSANMARQGKLDHVLDGKGPRERLTDLGARPTFTGENCAQGQQSGADAVQTWMGSPGHRANILNARFTHLGVGKADGEGGPYWTLVFARLEPQP